MAVAGRICRIRKWASERVRERHGKKGSCHTRLHSVIKIHKGKTICRRQKRKRNFFLFWTNLGDNFFFRKNVFSFFFCHFFLRFFSPSSYWFSSTIFFFCSFILSLSLSLSPTYTHTHISMHNTFFLFLLSPSNLYFPSKISLTKKRFQVLSAIWIWIHSPKKLRWAPSNEENTFSLLKKLVEGERASTSLSCPAKLPLPCFIFTFIPLSDRSPWSTSQNYIFYSFRYETLFFKGLLAPLFFGINYYLSTKVGQESAPESRENPQDGRKIPISSFSPSAPKKKNVPFETFFF